LKKGSSPPLGLFLAIVAGTKYDTKIDPVKELYKRVDHLILGGVMYNTFLCAKIWRKKLMPFQKKILTLLKSLSS